MGELDDLETAKDLFGAPEIPKQGRERIPAIAVELFDRNGFDAVGLDRVLQEVSVSKTAFYKHFESLTELQVEAAPRRVGVAGLGARPAPSSSRGAS